MLDYMRRKCGLPTSREREIKRIAEGLLSKHPRCHAKIYLAGPVFKDSNYFGDVIATTKRMIAWSEENAKSVWCPDSHNQAVRTSLPVLLSRFDPQILVPNKLQQDYADLVREFIPVMVEEQICEIHCPICNALALNIDQKKLNLDPGVFRKWTEEWYCGKGHLLYREKFSQHWHIRQR